MVLVAVAPALLALMGLVAIDGGRPIFGHTRIGRGGKPFKCLKIRSMCLDASERLAEILATDPVAAAEWARDAKLTHDPRITRIGAFLRRSSLDELPQLINVIRGEMSLVGPRPVPHDELLRYGDKRTSYEAVRPGLTGPWQVEGRNSIAYDDRVALDDVYARDHDLKTDVGIVLKTALSVLRMSGR